MLKAFFLCERRIGHWREQKRISPGICRIAGKRLRFIGAQCADAHDQWRLAADVFHCSPDRMSTLFSCEEGIAASASQQPNRVRACVMDEGEKCVERVLDKIACCIDWGEGKAERPLKIFIAILISQTGSA